MTKFNWSSIWILLKLTKTEVILHHLWIILWETTVQLYDISISVMKLCHCTTHIKCYSPPIALYITIDPFNHVAFSVKFPPLDVSSSATRSQLERRGTAGRAKSEERGADKKSVASKHIRYCIAVHLNNITMYGIVLHSPPVYLAGCIVLFYLNFS